MKRTSSVLRLLLAALLVAAAYFFGVRIGLAFTLPESTPSPIWAPPAILLAEDNEANQHVARRMPAKLGYQGQVATGLDVLLMDVQMSEMSGTEATSKSARSGPESASRASRQ